MIKVLDLKGLRQKVWDWMIVPGHPKPLLVWCQYGTFGPENVRDVIQTYRRTTDKVRITVNEDESVNIPSFIYNSLSRKAEGEKLVVVSFLPFGQESADYIMRFYEDEFESVRYQADVTGWLAGRTWSSTLNKPLSGFLKRHPEFFILPYGERPCANAVGPCPKTWEEVDHMWSEIYHRHFHEWKRMRRSDKIRRMLLCASTCIGRYEPMLDTLKQYLAIHRGYNKLLLPPPPEFIDECEHQTEAHFRDVFNEKGEPVWE